MNTRKLCLVLCIALVCVNLLFLAMYTVARNRLQTLTEAAVEDAAAYYTARGMEVAPETIRRDIPSNAILTFRREELREEAGALAERLSASFAEADGFSVVEAPNGVVCTIHAGSRTLAGIKIFDGAFSFEFALESASDNTYPADYFDNGVTNLEKDEKKAVDTFLRTLSESGASEYTVVGRKNVGADTCLCITQTVASLPVRDTYVVLTVRDGSVVAASGNYLFYEVRRSYEEPIIDGVNALRGLDPAKYVRVTAESLVYTYRSSGEGVVYLVPVWRIDAVTADGSAATLYVDAIA